MIPVTKTFLPPQDEYQAVLRRVWDAGWITNRGELVQELEEKLKSYLGVLDIIATTNGTLPLQIAIKALGLTGEIITTPFSYVATTSSIVWEGCSPVFVDINPEHLTIDETKIEAAITSKTSAILATHVYGNPCDVDAIEFVAKKYGLKVIYDAAHCFGVTYKGKSIFRYGDISTCSFHATKIFHTGEGGAIFCNSKELSDRCFQMHNFGHKGQEDFYGLGINAKMSEPQAAMGLALLPYMSSILKERKKVIDIYMLKLKDAGLQFLKIREGTQWNSSYFPVIFQNEKILLRVKEALEKENIFSRRYFFPSLNTLPYLKKIAFEITDDVSSSILCLPLFYNIPKEMVSRISDIIKENL